MSTTITLVVTGPRAGDINRTHCETLRDAFFYAYEEINRGRTCHVEIQVNDYVWNLDPLAGVFRAPEDTPA